MQVRVLIVAVFSRQREWRIDNIFVCPIKMWVFELIDHFSLIWVIQKYSVSQPFWVFGSFKCLVLNQGSQTRLGLDAKQLNESIANQKQWFLSI